MIRREKSARWHHNRFVWVAVVLLAVSAGAVVLVSSVRSEPQPEELRGQIMTRMRTALEQADPAQHHHAGHDAQQVATEQEAKPAGRARQPVAAVGASSIQR